jgi:hypothetical protein
MGNLFRLFVVFVSMSILLGSVSVPTTFSLQTPAD